MVIDSIEQLHERIEPMTHDFLTEQPLKGMSDGTDFRISDADMSSKRLGHITCIPFCMTGPTRCAQTF